MRTLPVISILLLTGCGALGISAGKYAKYPENPYPEYGKIAVLPVMQVSGLEHPVDVEEFGTTFATELAKFPGVMVIRPNELAAEVRMLGRSMTVDDAVRLAETFEADAVMALTVSDFDPYSPLKMAVQVQLVSATRTQPSITTFNIDALVRSGRWGEAPVRMDGTAQSRLADAFELVIDTNRRETHFAARQYAAAGSPDLMAFPEESDPTIYRTDRFMEFVSNEIVREFFKHHPSQVDHATRPE